MKKMNTTLFAIKNFNRKIGFLGRIVLTSKNDRSICIENVERTKMKQIVFVESHHQISQLQGQPRKNQFYVHKQNVAYRIKLPVFRE